MEFIIHKNLCNNSGGISVLTACGVGCGGFSALLLPPASSPSYNLLDSLPLPLGHLYCSFCLTRVVSQSKDRVKFSGVITAWAAQQAACTASGWLAGIYLPVWWQERVGRGRPGKKTKHTIHLKRI